MKYKVAIAILDHFLFQVNDENLEKFKALYPFDPDKSEVSKRWSKKEDLDLRAAVNCSVCKLNEHKEKNHFFNFIFNDELQI